MGLTDASSILVLDSFRAHTTDTVKETLETMNIKAPIIPGGCTSKVQPLDVCLNKPFKQLLRASWTQYLKQAVSSAQDGCKVKTATRQEVTNWIVRAWEAMRRKRELIKVFSSLCTGKVQSLVVQKDDIVRRTLDKVDEEFLEDIEDFDCEDPFADIIPEQDVHVGDSMPLVITNTG